MVRRILGVLVALVMVTGVIGSVTVTPAQATGYVSKAYHAPRKGQTSTAVKALQLRLVKAKALDKRYVTSYFGAITEKSVKRFQRRAHLAQTGKVDKVTWTRLVKKTGTMKLPAAAKKVAVKKRTKTTASSAYPRRGQTSAKVTELQQRLVKAKVMPSKYVTGYFGAFTTKAVKRFQRRYDFKQTGRVDATTWKKLVATTGKIKKPRRVRGIDSRCMVSGRAMCVDKTKDKLYYMRAGKVIKTLDARFGCAATRTREGTFSVLWKSRHHVSSIYHTPMPLAMFFSGGQAVHYSADFAARGYAGCSHGCVNIRDRSTLRWIFNQVRVGDRVVVYRS
ncbi:hypothetical protein GCM10009841_36590 [Microlunatus panaciterrae]|uniref:Peptidoglycan hydrolase-like protein with peptidoglycan-binding domain n=1 Tax=Microlunatus panaciterrae TaxID=400768 RepID=A0ABS2RHZ9_9ACTN|nr:peptidoglycan-binding protein [Microlunatus panaciterrae]MBM7798318.1 peptidoglycan hydrolase-like protein with peptidoglycan-binding domain [Microlunatus panaciterrae]